MSKTTFKVPAEFAGWSGEQLIRRHLLIDAMDGNHIPREVITPENVSELFEAADADGGMQDYLYKFRGSGIETGMEAPWSRHYEVKHVAACVDGGAWVGWAYWYGGGKHGEPEAMPWIEEAEVLEVDEEQVLSLKRTFRPASFERDTQTADLFQTEGGGE